MCNYNECEKDYSENKCMEIELIWNFSSFQLSLAFCLPLARVRYKQFRHPEINFSDLTLQESKNVNFKIVKIKLQGGFSIIIYLF